MPIVSETRHVPSCNLCGRCGHQADSSAGALARLADHLSEQHGPLAERKHKRVPDRSTE